MTSSYSIAEAKNRLPELVRTVEQDSVIQLTRRGTPVAMLMSVREYQRLQRPKVDFWEAYLAFRQQYDLEHLDLDIDAIYADVRDRSPGRDLDWE
jgi:PTS system cellobiose-specific IIB component